MFRRSFQQYLSKAFFATLIVSLFLFPTRVLAQQSIAFIQITSVDSVNFPDVTVRAIVRDGNNNPIPESDLKNLDLRENQQSVNSQYQTVEIGVEVIFVFDAGLSVSAGSSSGERRLEQMKEIVKSYIATMTQSDTIGITLVTSEGVSFPQPITSDSTALLRTLDQLTTDSPTYSAGINGILQALDELSNSSRQDQVMQSIVFLTPSIETGISNAQNAIDQAVKEGITIHTILVRDETVEQEALLQKISRDTRGLYAHYTGETSIKSIFNWLNEQRTQYLFRFRSATSVSSERTIELRTKSGGSGITSARAVYQVSVLPPVIVVDQPLNNEEFVRKANANSIDMAQLPPTSAKILAHVKWPDGHPRQLNEAILLVEKTPTGETLSAPPTNEIRFDWDLRPYRTPGSNLVKIQVRVMDEFGLQNESDPLSVKITVIEPPALPTGIEQAVEDTCFGKSGSDLIYCQMIAQTRILFTTPVGWVSLLSLIIATSAVLVAVRYRGRIAMVGVTAADIVRTTVSRLTQSGSLNVSAYLEVLSGDDSLTGKQIPLYEHSTVRAGRSPQEAALIFDMTNEHSVVSRRHCEFWEDGGVFKVRDLGSTHGTFINGTRLHEGGEGQVILEGDRIELGRVKHGGVLVVFHLAHQPKPIERKQP